MLGEHSKEEALFAGFPANASSLLGKVSVTPAAGALLASAGPQVFCAIKAPRLRVETQPWAPAA